MFSVFLSLLIPLLIGFLISRLVWRVQRAVWSHLLFGGSLGVGLGLGISSSIFFVWLLLFGPSRSGFVLIELALLICLTAILIYAIRVRSYPISSEPHSRSVPKLKLRWGLSIGFFIALASSILVSILLSLSNPHGLWDTWTTWNMRARFMFRGGDQWVDAFSKLLSSSQPDYPLLLPGIVARCWMYIGSETQVIPALISMLFTFAIVGLIFSSLSILRSKSQAFLAGLVLLGTFFFIDQGASQYADVPLAFFFLATIVLFCLQDRLSKDNYSLLFLAGMTAGFAAWTKNEGLLFLAAIIVARFVVIVPLKGWKAIFRQMFPFFIGFIPILIIIIYFKTQLAPPNVLLFSQGFQPILDKLRDFSRYFSISKAFVREIIQFDKGVVHPVPLLAFYLLCLGIKIEEKDKLSIATALITLCLMLTGYFFVYVITPLDLIWHLDHSLDRLLLQLWPSFLFTYFLIVGTPEQALMKKEN